MKNVNSSTIEKQISDLSTRCGEIEARKQDAERLADQTETQRRALLVKAIGEDDAEAKSEVERLAGESRNAHQVAEDFAFALDGLKEKLAGLREQLTKAKKVALINEARKLCSRRAELGKKVSADAAAFVRSVQETDQVSIELVRVLRAISEPRFDCSRLSRSAMSHALKALGQKASDGFQLGGMIEHDVNFLGWKEWDSKLLNAVATNVERCLADEVAEPEPAREAEQAVSAV
jgi:hypothetical protein